MTDQTPPPPPPTLPPPPYTPPPAGPQNGLGTTALVMGILQFVCLGPLASILAIVFGKLGMNKAKEGLATNGGTAKAGFWLGIVGIVLWLIGLVVFALVLAFGVQKASDSIDPANNSRTGLADGNYVMEPNTSLQIMERCSFGGTPVNVDTNESASSRVTVVGEGPIQCGSGSGTPDIVMFTVTGGVAEIAGVG